MKQRAGSLKTSIRLTNLWEDWKIKKEKTQINNIMNEPGDIMTEPTDTRRRRKCYKELYTYKFSNIDEWTTSLKKQLIQYEIDGLNSPIIFKEIENIKL